MQYVPLVIFIAIPVIVAVLMKTNVAILFLSVTASSVLQQYLDPNASTAANSILPNSGIDYMSLAVLVIPFFIVAVGFSKTVSSHQLPLHLILAALTGFTIMLLAGQFFPGNFIEPFQTTQTARLLSEYQTMVIGVGFLLSVAVLYFGSTKKHHKKH